MQYDQIITHLTDTDLYKFNMLQVIFHKHTDLIGEYHFKCRNEGVVWTHEMVNEIREQTDALCRLHFTSEELEYLRGIRFLKSDFVEFLKFWYPSREYVDFRLNQGELEIKVRGPIFAAMMFEIYLLEIVNEVYFRVKYADEYDTLFNDAYARLKEKVKDFESGRYTFKFADFGCRRRLSREWQDVAIRYLIENCPNCVGTSNVYLAMKYNIKPIGTFAHEFVQMYQGIEKIPLAYTNYYAMKDWFAEYNGDNGVALTDTLGTDLFLKDFDRLQASVYSGVRHDSGDPYEWGEKILAHYEKLGIDPKTKTLLFSDSLDFDKAQAIYEYFKDRTNVSFGIGTYVMNDTYAKPLNIVIKLQYVNGRSVAKLSDVPGKTMCDNEGYIEYLQEAVNFRLEN